MFGSSKPKETGGRVLLIQSDDDTHVEVETEKERQKSRDDATEKELVKRFVRLVLRPLDNQRHELRYAGAVGIRHHLQPTKVTLYVIISTQNSWSYPHIETYSTHQPEVNKFNLWFICTKCSVTPFRDRLLLPEKAFHYLRKSYT